MQSADAALYIGPAPARDSYLNIESWSTPVADRVPMPSTLAMLFSSERAESVEAVEAAGLIFIGPPG